MQQETETKPKEAYFSQKIFGHCPHCHASFEKATLYADAKSPLERVEEFLVNLAYANIEDPRNPNYYSDVPCPDCGKLMRINWEAIRQI